MTDIEKVIKGLELCSDIEHYGQNCGECPYKSKVTDFMCFKLLRDALELLKEHETLLNVLRTFRKRQEVK